MLEVYKNIKARREELKMTQTDLAQIMGYADKSMISRIEKGEIDLPQSKIIAFARALYIDPKILMGWDSDNFTHQERELMELFHLMTEEGQEVALNVLRGIAPQYKRSKK